MIRWLIFLLVIPFLSVDAFAFRVLTLNGHNEDRPCNFRSIVWNARKGKAALEKLRESNFSPECLNEDQKGFIARTNKKVRGIYK